MARCPGYGSMDGRCTKSKRPDRYSCPDCSALARGHVCAQDGCERGGASQGQFHTRMCETHHSARRERWRAPGEIEPPRVAVHARPGDTGIDVFQRA